MLNKLPFEGPKFMKEIFRSVDEKLSQVMTNMIVTGVLLVILGVLVAYNTMITQLLVAVVILVIAYSFFYGAYKISTIRKFLK